MLLSKAEKDKRLKAAMSGQIHIPKRMHRATQALFWEYRHNVRWKERGITPLFNLSKQDKNDTLSMYQLYMQCASDYEAALVILGNWDHWKKLCATPWFPRHLEKWRADRDERLQFLAQETVVNALLNGNITAAKHVLKEGMKTEATPKATTEPSLDDSEWLASAKAVLDKGEE